MPLSEAHAFVIRVDNHSGFLQTAQAECVFDIVAACFLYRLYLSSRLIPQRHCEKAKVIIIRTRSFRRRAVSA